MLAHQISPKVARWAWLSIAVLALASRFVGLDSTPLAPTETSRAVMAWDVAARSAWPAASDSTLLVVGNALLFALLGASEWVARLLPALAGVGLVGLPFLWRKELGEVGSLVAAALLLISPLSIFAAHRVSGASLTVLSIGLIAAGIFAEGSRNATTNSSSGTTRRPGTLQLALALALGVTGGPAFYDALFVGCLIWLAMRRNGIATESMQTVPWKHALPIGLAIALLISVAGGLHWSGWAGILDGAAAWLREWQTTADRGLSPTGLLLLYEPVLLICTATGLGLLFASKETSQSKTPGLLVLAAGLSILLMTARPGSTPEGLSLAIVPLAMFGGWMVDRLWVSLSRAQAQWIGLHTLVSGVFWLPGLLALAQKAGGLLQANQTFLVGIGLVIIVSLQLLVIFIFAVKLPPQRLWQGTLLGLTAIFTILQLGFAGGLAYVRSDQAVEPAIHTAGSHNMSNLSNILKQIAVQRKDRKDSLEIVLIDQDKSLLPTMRWALRDFKNVTVTAEWPDDASVVVVAPETFKQSGLTPDNAWQGARFVATSTATAPVPSCQIVPLSCSDALSWYLYRTSPLAATPTNIILWQADTPGN